MRPLHIITLLALTLLASACGSDNSIAPITGTMKGIVTLQDEITPQVPDYSGITVALDGTNLKTTTDVYGNWTLNDVPAGTYVVRYSKPGYVTHAEEGVQFVGGGVAFVPHIAYGPRLDAVPAYSVSSFSVVPPNSGSGQDTVGQFLKISVTISSPSPPGVNRIVTYIISSQSPAAASSTFPEMSGEDIIIPGSQTSATENISLPVLRTALKSGTRYYAVAFPGSPILTMGSDPVTHRRHPVNVTPASNEVSFVMP